MKPAKKTKKTLLERVMGVTKPAAPTPEPTSLAEAEKVVADAGISKEHAPNVAQLISTSLSAQSSLTRETF